MGCTRLVGGRRSGRQDAELAVNLHAVGVDHLAAERHRQIERRLAAAGRPGNDDDRKSCVV